MKLKACDNAIAHGWPIFPCGLNKKPLEKWKTYQTKQADEKLLESWDKLRDATCWGLATGEVIQCIVLDFDGSEGRALLKRLGLKPHVRTVNGGYHVYVRRPAWHVGNQAPVKKGDRVWEGLDCRGDGGYVVFCGQAYIKGTRDLGKYQVLRPLTDAYDPAVLPADLQEAIGFIRRAEEKPRDDTTRTDSKPLKNGSRPDASVLIDKALSRGPGRNENGLWLSCQLRDNSFSLSEAREAMTVYRGRCPKTDAQGARAPYTQAEAMMTLRSAYGRGAREGWGHRQRSEPPHPGREAAGGSPGGAPIESEPEQKKTRHFEQTQEGVYFIDDETDARTFVCSPLKVEAYTRDAESESWGRLLAWTDRTRHEHSWAMPMNMLAGDGTGLRETLLNGGVLIGTGPKARQLLLQYIQTENPGRSAVCVPQVGWYGHTFVFPDSAIPADAAETIIYQTAARGEHFHQTAGTLEEWRDCIGELCAGNSRLVFAVSAAFAGPLLRPLNVEGGGFHLVGTSSSGKSTVQWVAGSVCGGGHGAHGFARSWRFTQNALEAMAELHNDGLLILDEIREIPEAKDLDSIVYMLANGSGKGRMNKSMTAQRTLSWQLLILSSGEIKLSEYAASAGARIKAGAEVRLLNIPADAGADHGVFEDIHGAASARVFAEQLKAAAAKIYGTPLRSFLDKWVRNWEANVAKVAKFVTDFIAREIPPGAAPEVGRALRRVALVAAAGDLATDMGITGWLQGEAERAASKCFRDWIEERGGAGQADVAAGIRQVRAFIAVKGGSCFQSVVQHFDGRGNEMPERINERAGYWKEENGERQYLIFPDVFKTQVCRGFDSKLILKELAKKELLVKGEGRNFTKKETVPNEGQIRIYVVKAKILDEGEDD